MDVGRIFCSLPKWDYATAGHLVSSLPQEERNALTKTALCVLQTLIYLFGLSARKSGRGAAYATPGQTYLGKMAARSSRTVRRALHTLESMGLLVVQRRGVNHGMPQSNLYKLGGRLLALLYNLYQRKSPTKSRADKNVLQRPKERYDPPDSIGGGSLNQHKSKLSSLPFRPMAVPAGRTAEEQRKIDARKQRLEEMDERSIREGFKRHSAAG